MSEKKLTEVTEVSKLDDEGTKKLLGDIAYLAEELGKLKAKEEEREDSYLKMPKTVEGKITRADKPGEGGGWAVRTPYEAYEGITCGIEFRGGIGIVDVELPDCERIVHKLEHDFGYSVQALEAAELTQMRKAQAMHKAPPKTLEEKLSQPARIG